MRINERIYPLLQTLSSAGLAWLSKEVEEGLVAGRVPIANEEQLAHARAMAKREQQDEGFQVLEFADPEPEPEPFTLEEQLDWTERYVVERLNFVLSCMAVSIANIDSILEPTLEARESLDAGKPGTTTIALRDGDVITFVTAEDLAIATEEMRVLQRELAAWRASPTDDDGVGARA